MVRESDRNSSWTNIVLVGSLQHGKSTVAGFLLQVIDAVNNSILAEATIAAHKRGTPERKFAFLLDRMPVERRESTKVGYGQTKAVSSWGFKEKERRFLLIDTPSQSDRLIYVTGALLEADAVLLVIDSLHYLTSLRSLQHSAIEQLPALNVVQQTQMFLTLARFYGIKQIVIALHKMDRINFAENDFQTIQQHIKDILTFQGWNDQQIQFIPTAINVENGKGHNIIESSNVFSSWFTGPTLYQSLTTLVPRPVLLNADLKMQVQPLYVKGKKRSLEYKFDATGKILTGRVRVGDTLLLLPSNTLCQVNSLQFADCSVLVGRKKYWEALEAAYAGEVVQLNCNIREYGDETNGQSQIQIGEMMVAAQPSPQTTQKIRLQLVPLDIQMLSTRLPHILSLGSFSMKCHINAFSQDNGLTWHFTHSAKASSALLVLLATLNTIIDASALFIEVELETRVPFETYATTPALSRILLWNSPSSPLYGGYITEIF